MSAADRAFIQKAAESGLAEIQLGKLAEQKAFYDAVKAYGKRMAAENTEANVQLHGIASSRGVTFPQALDAKDQALYDRLSGLSGVGFDQAYMRAMVEYDNQRVSEYRRAATTGHDQAVRSFAAMQLSGLQAQVHTAREVRHTMGISATAEANHTPESALQK